MTAVRWGMVLDLPPPLKVLCWLDLTLALVGTAALLYARHQKPSGGGDGTSTRPPGRTPAALALAAALGAIALLGYGLLQAPPEPRFASDEDHFKYGSILKPWLPGLPLRVFEALPDTFPDLLPGGWASVGFVLEPGHATPVGWALQPALIPSLAPNCALCHGATYRVDSGESPRFVSGAPAVSLDFHRFLTVIFKAGADPRFTDGTPCILLNSDVRSDSFSTPAFTSSVILPNCSLLLIAPMSVFLSKGSPTRSVANRRFNRASTSPATLSCTSNRDPAQHTCP
jgi:hypothetical protein